MDWRIGVTDLLSPDKCTLLLIDHQGMQLTGVQNIDGTLFEGKTHWLINRSRCTTGFLEC